jgi:hypothetical protein
MNVLIVICIRDGNVLIVIGTRDGNVLATGPQ